MEKALMFEELWFKVAKINSTETAEKHRVKGNEHFKRREFVKALTEYNRSITLASIFAAPESKELALAYGNRSAVYFQTGLLKECMQNIGLARENGFPPEKIHQLDEREEKCNLKRSVVAARFDPWRFFKLSHPPNKRLPFIANCIKLCHDSKFGRHVTTNCDLKPGDIVAIEEPLFKFIDLKSLPRRCFVCLKSNNLNLIPWANFSPALYCSKDCQTKDVFHKEFECLKSPTITSDILIMVLSSIRIAGGVDGLISLLSDETSKTVFNFNLSNPDDPSYEKNLLVAVNSLWKEHSDLDQTITTEQLLEILPTEDKNRGNEELNLLLKFVQNTIKIFKTNSQPMVELEASNQLLTVGYGLFPFTSLLSHSCYPNVERITVDNKFALVVNRPIVAGEQLFISYGPHFATDSIEKRRIQMGGYSFRCECVACLNDFPMMLTLPRRDCKFVLPSDPASIQEVIKRFGKNCKYIEKHAWDHQPCLEALVLMVHNSKMLRRLASPSCAFED